MAQSVLLIRNQTKFTDSGYAYTFDKLSADKTLRFYRCDKRYDDCPARIHVSVETDAIVRRVHDHNHGNDAACIEAARVVVGVKRRCAENQELPGQLVATALQNVLPDELQPVLAYFEMYYTGRRRNDNIRRQPLFEKSIWSVHARTVNNQDRTNNHAEAAHRKLQAVLQMDHPSLWKFIDNLMRVQKETDFRYEQYVRGDQNVPKRKKYRDADERILTIVTEYLNREILEYLHGIAHNFQMQ